MKRKPWCLETQGNEGKWSQHIGNCFHKFLITCNNVYEPWNICNKWKYIPYEVHTTATTVNRSQACWSLLPHPPVEYRKKSIKYQSVAILQKNRIYKGYIESGRKNIMTNKGSSSIINFIKETNKIDSAQYNPSLLHEHLLLIHSISWSFVEGWLWEWLMLRNFFYCKWWMRSYLHPTHTI